MPSPSVSISCPRSGTCRSKRSLPRPSSGSIETDTYWPLWLLALKTGLRRGELLGIRWKDLDLDKGTLQVQQTVVLLNGSPIIQTPKTTASRRVVKLSADLVAALSTHRAAWAERQLASAQWADCDLVF